LNGNAQAVSEPFEVKFGLNGDFEAFESSAALIHA
jgi:hypothetical protein